MISSGLFTNSDFVTINKAAVLAEELTQSYFHLAANEWKSDPFSLFTVKELGFAGDEQQFAQVIRYQPNKRSCKDNKNCERYGVVLLDPNILFALLRSVEYDLWSLLLFVLTHELVHIVRFRKFNIDFHALDLEKEKEEQRVHNITREILAGSKNTDYIFKLYENSPFGDPKAL